MTWTGTFSSTTPGLGVQWQWAAAVYTRFDTAYNALGVKPVDDNHASQYQNSDHSETPENYKQYVTGGARGGGGSNFTGSLSSNSLMLQAACDESFCAPEKTFAAVPIRKEGKTPLGGRPTFVVGN